MEKSTSIRNTAILVGILFIVATVASSASIVLSEPILDSQDYLSQLSINSAKITLAALLMFIDAVAVAAIAIVIQPVLKKYSGTVALGYLGARLVESVFFILYVIILLALLTLGGELATATELGAQHLMVTGNGLRWLMDWSFTIGYGFVFTISALILNVALLLTGLIPRWLSIWGILGAIISMILNVLVFYDIHLSENLDFVIAIQEMVFAVWLIAKGFNMDALGFKNS